MKRFIRPATAFLLLISSLHADKITLKNGDELEGTVLEKREDDYRLLIQVTPSIREERIYPKSEIAEITPEEKDAQPFEEISKILPIPDRLTTSQYEKILSDKINPFLEKFPGSKHLKKVNEIKTLLEKDLVETKKGSLKIAAQWITEEEQEANAYDFDAEFALSEIQRKVDTNKIRSALVAYDQMVSAFPKTKSLTEATQEILAILPGYERQIKLLSANSAALKKQREEALMKLTTRDRSRLRDQINEESKLFMKGVEKAEKIGTKWIPADPYHDKELKTLLSHISLTL